MVVTANPPEHLLDATLPVIGKFAIGGKFEFCLGKNAKTVNQKSSAPNKIGHEKLEVPAFKIVEIPCKGFGMVATKKLFPGDLILAEKPLFIISEEIFSNVEICEEYLEKAVEKLSCKQRELFLGLSDKREQDKGHFDPNPYCGIFYTNAMAYEDDTVLCPEMARANHSCRANAEFVARPDLGEQHLVTNYMIMEGEEITINYMSMVEEGSDTKETRQSYLRRLYGFQCTCRACTLQGPELAEDEHVRENVKELQAAGEENLDPAEIENLISKVYQIQGKHSYILDLFQMLYRSAPVGSLRMVEYAVNGFTIAVNLYGVGSKEANEWRNQIDFQKSVNLLIMLDENLY